MTTPGVLPENTVFGSDMSHYDEPLRARDGLDFFTHKLTDGDHFYEDAEFKASLEAARALGIPILGAYHVLWGNASIQAQAAWFIERLDALVPWWRTLPPGRFILQADAEPFAYMKAPTISQVNQWLTLVTSVRGSRGEGQSYSPVWYYSTAVTALRFGLWQSNYGANPALPYRDAYPGNHSSRWAAPIDPTFLQYGSNTTIAGQTTCDANAYRGNLAALIAELGGNGPSIGDATMAVFQVRKSDGTTDPRVWTTDLNRKRQLPNREARDAALKLAGQAEVIVLNLPTRTPAITVDDWAREVGGPDDVELGSATPTPTPPSDALTDLQLAQTLRLQAAALTKSAELLEAPAPPAPTIGQ